MQTHYPVHFCTAGPQGYENSVFTYGSLTPWLTPPDRRRLVRVEVRSYHIRAHLQIRPLVGEIATSVEGLFKSVFLYGNYC